MTPSYISKSAQRWERWEVLGTVGRWEEAAGPSAWSCRLTPAAPSCRTEEHVPIFIYTYKVQGMQPCD
jgi:hypothetical protein